jgi:hypothetical protein
MNSQESQGLKEDWGTEYMPSLLLIRVSSSRGDYFFCLLYTWPPTVVFPLLTKEAQQFWYDDDSENSGRNDTVTSVNIIHVYNK